MLELQNVSVSWEHPGRGWGTGEESRKAHQARKSVCGEAEPELRYLLEVSQALHNHVISFCGVKCGYSVGIA